MAWRPRFRCPECTLELSAHGAPASPASPARSLVCPRCSRTYTCRAGVWRFLSPERRAAFEPFAQQYRAIRQAEGRRNGSPDYYRALPVVAPDDPHARDWRIRRETYGHLLHHVLAAGHPSSAVLDLGAGSGWLSHRLATLGHRVVAVDALADVEDAVDGLGAVRYYDTPLTAVEADFDALPFVPGQFDLVVFNGSLHYSPDVAATLARARRMLVTGGALVVMDSPMFRADDDGAAMVEANVERFRAVHERLRLERERRRARGEWGWGPTTCDNDIVRPGVGYLTFTRLTRLADALRLREQFVRSRGPAWWRIRRQFARIRLGRQPATFGLWVAR